MAKEKNNIEIKRHSLSHIMAAAVLEMFPEAKLGIGPTIENGFYYDFELPRTLIPEDLPLIEERMRARIKRNEKFEKTEVPIEKGLEITKKADQPYKTELIKDLAESGHTTVTFYKVDSFTDLCAGPHISSTSDLGPFKLVSIAGAYWKGDEKNKMLQRIYGVAFNTQEELEKYLAMMEEAKKRDHKKLGPELGLFIFSELVGPGLPLYTHKGATLRSAIQNYSNELRTKIGYEEVWTPQINKAELFKISGHYDKYKDDMFRVISNYSKEEYYLKPMNCPQHTQIYASKLRSYKDLPVRIADFANLYRDEKPGQLSGLVRLRAFAQDDGHCFCREDQIEDEFERVLGVIEEAMKTYGMKYYIRLSLRDEKQKEKYLGDDTTWKKSQKILDDLLKRKKVNYVRAEGEAAFYGPKMDLIAEDSLGREWQLSTIQLDLNMPARFKLEYIDETGKKKTPVMIHSAIVGSPERFMGVLIEHYGGDFPLWLAPIQVRILPISDRHLKAGIELKEVLKDSGIKTEIDETTESVGKKIRQAEMEKIPYMIILGDKEIESKKFAVRSRKDGDLGQISQDDLVKKLRKEIEEKR